MNPDSMGRGPTRIELASSEMEGGSIVAWVDPQQVLACVAQVDTRETFSRFLEPRLAEIDRPTVSAAGEGAANLPPRVRALLERVKQTHRRLYRENQTQATSARVIRPVLASLEEKTVFFIKATRCWVFRVRDGASELIRSGGEAPGEGGDDPGLGGSARLHLAVSSVDVLANDIVVLLAADGEEGPDRRAVSRVFDGSQDLKRACDGLVNLFSLTSSGVGAVAMRFVPVGAHNAVADTGTRLLEDLGRELAAEFNPEVKSDSPTWVPRAHRSEGPPPDQGLEEFVLPSFLEAAGYPRAAGSWEERRGADSLSRLQGRSEPHAEETGFVPAQERAFVPPAEPPLIPAQGSSPAPMAETSPVPPDGSLSPDADRDLHAARPSEVARPAKADEAAGAAARERDLGSPMAGGREPVPSGGRSALSAPPAGRKGTTQWLLAFGVVLLMLIAVLGIPRGIRLLRGGGDLAAGGVLRVDPDPPARAIFIDGVDQETGSPAILEGIAPGAHEVLLDLGAFGSMEIKVRVRTGETLDLRPHAKGSLEISVVEPRPGAKVWLSGRDAMSLPCTIDTLQAGWQEIFYEDDRLPLWQRQVLILAGETTRVRINNSFDTNRSLLRVESWSYQEGEGLRVSDGDSIFVDRRFVGVTPFEREIDPGLHGVRVEGRRGMAWAEVLDLPAGASRVVAPRFGLEPWPTIVHHEPGRVLLRGPVLLTATFSMPDGSPPLNPRLHLPALDAPARDLPLAPVEYEQGVYVGVVDQRWVPLNARVDYYFTVQTTDGQTLSSELYRLTAVSEISAALP